MLWNSIADKRLLPQHGSIVSDNARILRPISMTGPNGGIVIRSGQKRVWSGVTASRISGYEKDIRMPELKSGVYSFFPS